VQDLLQIYKHIRPREGTQGVHGGATHARARREKRVWAEGEDGSERAVKTMRKRGGP